MVRYTLGEQQERNIFASRYQLYLPTVEELQQELVRERRQIVPAESAKPAAKRRATQKKVEGKKRCAWNRRREP